MRGVVAQTHASSPRCSAYLAAQLKELAAVLKAKAPAAPATPELGRLVVFGAGDKYVFFSVLHRPDLQRKYLCTEAISRMLRYGVSRSAFLYLKITINLLQYFFSDCLEVFSKTRSTF